MLWLSLGENCLPDDILKRHGKKAFSSPYASGRSNIDYALALEQVDYDGLLDPETLVRGKAGNFDVVRSTRFAVAEEIYDSAHLRGFEFTHHDPISKEEDREAFQRRIGRLKEIRGKERVGFLYHHRRGRRQDLDAVRSKLQAFASLYGGADKCLVAMFYQMTTADPEQRRLETKEKDGAVLEFVFHTHKQWAGGVADEFWARVDEDLITVMVRAMDDCGEERPGT